MNKKSTQFFQDKSLGKKEAPAGSWRAKKKFLKDISKGHLEKGSAKGMKTNCHGWSLSLSLSIGLGKIL